MTDQEDLERKLREYDDANPEPARRSSPEWKRWNAARSWVGSTDEELADRDARGRHDEMRKLAHSMGLRTSDVVLAPAREDLEREKARVKAIPRPRPRTPARRVEGPAWETLEAGAALVVEPGAKIVGGADQWAGPDTPLPVFPLLHAGSDRRAVAEAYNRLVHLLAGLGMLTVDRVSLATAQVEEVTRA